MKYKKEINVFIASPGDVKEERSIVRDVRKELNESPWLKDYGFYFEATGWEDAFPSPGRPQEIINRLVDECDIFICVFHKRFGSPTGEEEAGTLEEFLLAYDSWKTFERPHILFYFKEVKIRSMKDLEDPQLKKVLDLKEKIEREKLLLFNEFSTPDEFREKITDHLQKWIIEYAKGQKKIGEKIEKAYKVDQSFRSYLQSALNEHRHLPTQGFETTLRVPIELERVYINMHAHIHSYDFEYNLKGKSRMDERVREEKLPSLDIKAAFKSSERHKINDLVILGNPGSGKTTLLKYILVMLIEGKGREKLGIKENLTPFFTPLRELTDAGMESITAFINRVCYLDDYKISEESLETLLNEGKGIILLDGLDEVADEETRIRTCRWIDRARRRFADTPFIITSRFAGYMGKSRLEGSVLELSIQDFTPDEVKEFLLRWFEAVETALHPDRDEAKWRKRGHDEALTLFDRISRSEHIKKLAVNPLLLQIIALVHRDRGTLPQRRVELYDECTNVLLEKWDMAKGLDVLITSREARQILQPLALWLHQVDERRSASMEDIKEVIKQPLEEIGKSNIDPKELLLNIRDRSGIFMGYSETEYGFTHLSFQEYLTAEQIRNEGEIDILLSNYGKRWWREVLLLCLALNNPSIIEEFMKRLIPTENFKSEIGLAISALQDSIKKPSKPFIDAISNEDLLPEARYNAIRVLKEIGGDKVIHVLTEAVKKEDKRLALSAFEALDAIGVAEGISKPVVEEAPELFISPVDNSEMVLVPAGTFLYGSRDDDKFAGSNEKPQRVIELESFYVDKFPVTNEQFCKFLNDKTPNKNTLDKWIDLKGSLLGEKCRIQKEGNKYIVQKGYERHPVINVTWFGADEYAKWSGKRLPTEQEWEKAARGADGRIYPWGNDFDKDLFNSHESGTGGTTEVGRFADGASPYGCMDMAGNVWEWTSSWYDDEKKYSVFRGGSWDDLGVTIAGAPSATGTIRTTGTTMSGFVAPGL